MHFQASVISRAIAASICLISMPNIAEAQSEIFESQSGTISEVGDIVQIALPAGALIGSLWIGDTEGAWQLTKVVATTAAITHTLKFGYERLRPDGSEANSFPSGHTSAAFSGAAYIHHRYGNAWGIPAYAAAAFVGGSRLWSNRHYVDDVLAGASIAVMSSLYFTDPYNRTDLVIAPSFGEEHIGLAMSYTPGLAGNKSQPSSKGSSGWGEKKSELKHSYTLSIGGFNTKENTIYEQGKSSFDLNDFSKESEPNTYASALLKWGLDEQQYLVFEFTPLETRDTVVLKEDINFGGKNYSTGSEVISAYRSWSLSGDYMVKLLPDSAWKADVGAGLTVVGQSIRLDNYDGDNLSEHDDIFIVPSLAVEAGYQFTESISASVGYKLSGLSDYESDSLWGSIAYQISERWSTSLFYGQFAQKTDTDEYYNDAIFDFGGFSVDYSF
ncbi:MULTISPECIES: phosphatase PAP2 family protein [unclassified Shewanella]|uniref:phosphatase PAP2 family protein n=1 Tax=unclassified Shewanella TaxID=196818 RepID=UPI000C79AD97|nr:MULTISPECIES: phosphatase PAP2 family protein [unclassified Shewanella]PKG57938.1 PA-phosphatase [Shewanella sp. GutDb-MelDb]PKG73574.1 PA-phosphatase [Shewanella sp. GutCb]